MVTRFSFSVCALLGLATLAPAVHAQTLTATGRGWLYSGGGNGNAANNNYFAGDANGITLRDHFDFAIPTLSGTLTGATLQLDEPIGGHFGAATTYTVYSLGAYGTYTLSDIGSGTAYGSVGLDFTSNGTTVSITLNSSALAAINAAQGNTFSLGGVDSGEKTSSSTYDFAGTENATSQLVLTTGAAVPEPGSIALLTGIGVCGTGLLARRRRTARK